MRVRSAILSVQIVGKTGWANPKPFRRESRCVGWITTNPWDAQNAVSGEYPSRFQPLPWENTTTGRFVPAAGADTRTSSGTGRSGANNSTGATETTGAPAPMMPFRVSIIDEVMASSLLRLHPAILFIGASLRNITERCSVMQTYVVSQRGVHMADAQDEQSRVASPKQVGRPRRREQALLAAAAAVVVESGVDGPVRGVGAGAGG